MAIDRLKKALSEYPSGLSLQTTLKAAVEEVTVSGHVHVFHTLAACMHAHVMHWIEFAYIIY